MVEEHPFVIQNASGDTIRGDLRYVNERLRKPLIVICHGFNTNKDWGPFPYSGKCLAERGYATIVFNFSHNGVGPGSSFDYERFSQNTPGKELEDVQAILDAVGREEVGSGVVDRDRIGMAGHSRGGAISILTARMDRRVRSVVAWSTIEIFLRYSVDEREQWLKTGYHPLRYGSARTLLRYHVSVLRDNEDNAERYDISRAAALLKVPTLFVHGSDDEIVDIREAKNVFENSDKSLAEFHVIENADHTYGAQHPLKEETSHLREMMKATGDWFHKTI